MGATENVPADPHTRPKRADQVQFQRADGMRTTRGQEVRIGRGTNGRNGVTLMKHLKTAAIVTSKKASATMKTWMTAAAGAALLLRHPAGRIISTDKKRTTEERAEAVEVEKIIPPTATVTLGLWETLIENIVDAIYDAILCTCSCLKNYGSESTYVDGSSYYYTYDGSCFDSVS